ncbi:MAG: PEP-CTERM system histidine kinase PrsK [Novosphingobium sp.]|nr:PEP-CTERM system histidine kinase PrsK [Novosphingobium sp.]MCP5402500.1 PEP-CTERM system histidine kinase PrsK [Novosphingobium sp.]
MPVEGAQIWILAGQVVELVAAIAATTIGVWLLRRRDRFGPAGTPVVAALFLTAAACLTLAASGTGSLAGSIAETIRNFGWLVVIYHLFASDGRHTSVAPIRPVVLALVFVELLHLGVDLLLHRAALGSGAMEIAFDLTVMFRLLVTVGALVLVHNLYAGASSQSRLSLRWPAAGLGTLWAFDLNLYTVAYLSNGWPQEIAAFRGLAVVVLACLLVIGAAKDRDELRFRPSRTVAFQTFSLLIIGAYLIAMVAIAQWLSFAGGNFARLMELGFLTIASVLAILILPSPKLRRWLKVTLSKHLFQHRYDYRAEWLRFTRTIGKSGKEASPLGERIVQAVADIAESPGGLLLAPADQGDFTLAARWQWPEIEVPAVALSTSSFAFFERGGFIAELDDLRSGQERHGEAAHVPEWMLVDKRAWALVPLIHYEQLVGMVVLARPPLPRGFDWEDFDLLRVVGQQLASYLAEHASQEALAEASRFDDFHRRIAFVMHDIKNLASQLSLLARNAELHADKPEFRDDMLVTLRNSADKLNGLLARLSRYGAGSVESMDQVPAADVAKSVVDSFRGGHPVVLGECHECMVTANRESLEQVLVHLVQNGIDASPDNRPVFLGLTCDGLNASFEVLDSGCGMSPDFVRNRLFKPFVSSKQGGFGLGAFEARELVRAMRGRLEVESREGLGSRFIVRLPLTAASDLYDNFASSEQRTAS